MSLISHYFGRHKDGRGAALGIAASGVGVGGFTLAAVTQVMITTLGIGWSLVSSLAVLFQTQTNLCHHRELPDLLEVP